MQHDGMHAGRLLLIHPKASCQARLHVNQEFIAKVARLLSFNN
jgi:hypothetical protein